ncbi:MAG: cytochrome c biogenesis protein ResB [Rikenellaceae bacterium]|nr:cytochrome c biogenesis protein ResB [Rikenellaceae bacterium]
MAATHHTKTLQEVICGVALLVVAFILQAVAGDFPIRLFRFPLNLLLLLLWALLLYELYRRRDLSLLSRWLLSPAASWFSFLLLVGVGICLGLQREPASAAWPVVVSLLVVQTVLGMVILRGWRNAEGIRYAFLLHHVGLWLALAGLFWGAPDREQLRLVVEREAAAREAYRMDGTVTVPDFSLRLKEFHVSEYENGTPSFYEAVVELDSREVSLRVNHPYRRNFAEALYLISYDREAASPRYCILEVVREPWRGMTAAGLWMMILGASVLFVRGSRTRGGESTNNERMR